MMTSRKADTKRDILALAILGLTIAAVSSVQGATHLIQEPRSVIGNAAPTIKLEKLLQAPPNTSTDWEKLKGRVVVLDFWATWCSPCIGEIPHLNQLAAEFSGQPVVFISITDDNEDRLKDFLKKTPIKTWIGIDAERANWPGFGVHAIPATIIVGADGRVVAATRPESVTSQVLHDVLAGKPVALPALETRDSNLEWDQDEIEWKDGIKPLFEIIIKLVSTATAGTWLRPEGNYFTADGAPLSALVQVAYGTDYYHLDWRLPRDTQAYRVAARVPRGRESQLLPLLQNTLTATFNLKTSWQPEEKDVYVLRVPANEQPRLTAAAADQKPLFQSMRGKATAQRKPISELSQFLTRALSLLVVDETGLSGAYNWELPYQPGQTDVTFHAVREQLGLELIKARRSVKMLVVEVAEANKNP